MNRIHFFFFLVYLSCHTTLYVLRRPEVLPLQRYVDSLVADLDEQNRISKRALSAMREGQIQHHVDNQQQAADDAEAYRQVYIYM